MDTPSTLADRTGLLFDGLVMKQGFATWFKGEVLLSHASDRAVHAQVKGKRESEVRLACEAGRLLASCSCLADDARPTCKHVWATLLETDRRGALDPLRRARTRIDIGRLAEPAEAGEAKREEREERERKKKPKQAKAAKPSGRPSPRSPRPIEAPLEARPAPRPRRRRR